MSLERAFSSTPVSNFDELTKLSQPLSWSSWKELLIRASRASFRWTLRELTWQFSSRSTFQRFDRECLLSKITRLVVGGARSRISCRLSAIAVLASIG